MRTPLVLALLVACGGGEKAPPVAAPAPRRETIDASAPPPAPTVSGVDSNALAQLLAAAAAAGPAAMAPMTPMEAGDSVERGLREAAAVHAAAMTPEGQVAKGILGEGGHLGFVVKMEPTKCYTIVGYGAGVDDLDLYLLVPPFYNLLGAHDVTTGPSAVIGSAPKMCPMTPIAIPYKIDIHAKKGAGEVAAQVYSKPK